MNINRNVLCALCVAIQLTSSVKTGAQRIDTKIPQYALSGQLKRHVFSKLSVSRRVYDVSAENDLNDIDYTIPVTIRINKDLSLRNTWKIPYGANVIINGGGKTLSAYTQKTKESAVYEAVSWNYDKSTKVGDIELPQDFPTVSVSPKDDILVVYELWFVRQEGRLLSVENGHLRFKYMKGYEPFEEFRSWTPKPKFYLLYKNTSSSSLEKDNMIYIDKGAKVKMSQITMSGAATAILSCGELFAYKCIFKDMAIAAADCEEAIYSDFSYCTFKNIGLKCSNNACVSTRGDIYVGHSNFVNFNYSAIRVGNISTSDPNVLPSSLIEYNTLTWDNSWQKKINDYGLRDGGAIYVCTNNRKAIIRYNKISNFGGHGFNRAIFCDDGAYNQTIYGNTIKGTQNYYDIDSRDCSMNSTRLVPMGYYENTYNYIGYNDCEGRVCLQGSSAKSDNNCCFENNRVLDILLYGDIQIVVTGNKPGKKAIIQ